MTVRVALADDHRLFRDGLASLLERVSGIDVVAVVDGGEAAIGAAREHQPDVVVMDVSMPSTNGIEATRVITREVPSARVLVVSMHVDRDTVSSAIAAGAMGYLSKGCAAPELIEAIRTVAAGRSYLTPDVTDGVLRELADLRAASTDVLTSRERSVLQLIAEGHSTAAVAEHLGISAKTVASHREHLMTKLGIHSVAGLTKYAVRHGITTLDHGS